MKKLSLSPQKSHSMIFCLRATLDLPTKFSASSKVKNIIENGSQTPFCIYSSGEQDIW